MKKVAVKRVAFEVFRIDLKNEIKRLSGDLSEGFLAKVSDQIENWQKI